MSLIVVPDNISIRKIRCSRKQFTVQVERNILQKGRDKLKASTQACVPCFAFRCTCDCAQLCRSCILLGVVTAGCTYDSYALQMYEEFLLQQGFHLKDIMVGSFTDASSVLQKSIQMITINHLNHVVPPEGVYSDCNYSFLDNRVLSCNA